MNCIPHRLAAGARLRADRALRQICGMATADRAGAAIDSSHRSNPTARALLGDRGTNACALHKHTSTVTPVSPLRRKPDLSQLRDHHTRRSRGSRLTLGLQGSELADRHFGGAMEIESGR
jgi:hypothetical protein